MSDTGDIQRSGTVPRTVASFFSGGGGATLGLVRAGWEPVAFSEIERFPIAVLKTHWPEVPNIGDITAVGPDDVPDATLWMGGFPCQDLSLAGPRRGLRNADGSLTRSGLAFAFLGLAAQRRPPVLLLENVSGLRSSNNGRDLLALLDQVGDIGYSVAFRELDSQWAGVPQRRKRVFLLAFDLERYPDEYLPGEVLGIASCCPRDHQQEREAWQAATSGPEGSPGVGFFNATAAFGQWAGPDIIAGTVSRRDYKSPNHLVVGPQAHPYGGGETDGIPGRVHDPQGLDSHRFKVIGNGVVATMSQWIGQRLDARLP